VNFLATKSSVYNRGAPPDAFLVQLVEWGKLAPEEIFALNNEPDDVYNLIRPVLGPWESILHRRSAMLETLRVLGGFESSWNWNEGPDETNPTEDSPETMSAGLWQISWNSVCFGEDLQKMASDAGIQEGVRFQEYTKQDHWFAMEWATRLFRHTTQHNGPLKRGEILPWLSRDAVDEFMALL